MKPAEVSRLAQATDALRGRLRVAAARLNEIEQLALAAVEPLAEIRGSLQEAFERWEELSNELDPDSEIAPVMLAPDLDFSSIETDLEVVFGEAHAELQKSIGDFEDILDNAGTYEAEDDSEEDEGDASEPEGENFGCHAYACHATSPGCDTLDEAEEAALMAGWKFDPKGWPYCPKHRSQA